MIVLRIIFKNPYFKRTQCKHSKNLLSEALNPQATQAAPSTGNALIINARRMLSS